MAGGWVTLTSVDPEGWKYLWALGVYTRCLERGVGMNSAGSDTSGGGRGEREERIWRSRGGGRGGRGRREEREVESYPPTLQDLTFSDGVYIIACSRRQFVLCGQLFLTNLTHLEIQDFYLSPRSTVVSTHLSPYPANKLLLLANALVFKQLQSLKKLSKQR